MPAPTLEQLLALLDADPADSFTRYAVAMAYSKQGQYDQAVDQFRELLRRDPKYVAAYFMGGRALQQKGDLPAARTMYQDGIAMAKSVGDHHAASEISDALHLLEQVM